MSKALPAHPAAHDTDRSPLRTMTTALPAGLSETLKRPAMALGSLGQQLVLLASLTLLILWPCLLEPLPAWALIHAHPDESTATGVVRSLESLRDLDYQSWQVVAYREGPPRSEAPITLRIVSYPGRVRLDHPTPLLVTSGRRLWELADTTLTSPKLAGDGRAAAAEFDLTPLLNDLETNRPLRLQLPGVFTELPVPPYVVKEWRKLPLADPP